jgi:methionyl-tRNA formyltransferase
MIVGQKWFAAEVLKLCLEMGIEVTAVAPAAVNDRLSAAAGEAKIPVTLVEKRLVAEHIPSGTDLIVAAHAHCYITAEARAGATHGAIGYHPSLLPRHRGRDAIRWAIHMREQITGGTVYRMDDRADGGAIVAQDWCHIRPGDTADELWRRELAPMGLRLIKKTLSMFLEGESVEVPQDETLATWEPAFTKRRLSGE